jgi:natural product precursor
MQHNVLLYKILLINYFKLDFCMKKLAKLKLNAFKEQDLLEKQMNALRGGDSFCSCSCYWEGNGGSSSNSNRNANYNLGSGSYSTNGCNQYQKIVLDGGYTIYHTCYACDESTSV